jgi:hypothetical protein
MPLKSVCSALLKCVCCAFLCFKTPEKNAPRSVSYSDVSKSAYVQGPDINEILFDESAIRTWIDEVDSNSLDSPVPQKVPECRPKPCITGKETDFSGFLISQRALWDQSGQRNTLDDLPVDALLTPPSNLGGSARYAHLLRPRSDQQRSRYPNF